MFNQQIVEAAELFVLEHRFRIDAPTAYSEAWKSKD
jgi:hypothetical protein